MSSLASGTYILTEDVKNPHPDRRYRDQFEHAKVWEKGSLVYIEPGNDHGRIRSHACYGSIWPSDDGYPLLVAAMAPFAEKPHHMIRRLHGRGSSAQVACRILEKLVDSGRLTMAELESLSLWTDEDELEAQDERNGGAQ